MIAGNIWSSFNELHNDGMILLKMTHFSLGLNIWLGFLAEEADKAP